MTPEQIKSDLHQQGITIAQWADDHGYPRAAVYRVLNGVEKAAFGRAHEIAVSLGLKPQTPSQINSTHPDPRDAIALSFLADLYPEELSQARSVVILPLPVSVTSETLYPHLEDLLQAPQRVLDPMHPNRTFPPLGQLLGSSSVQIPFNTPLSKNQE